MEGWLWAMNVDVLDNNVPNATQVPYVYMKGTNSNRISALIAYLACKLGVHYNRVKIIDSETNKHLSSNTRIDNHIDCSKLIAKILPQRYKSPYRSVGVFDARGVHHREEHQGKWQWVVVAFPLNLLPDTGVSWDSKSNEFRHDHSKSYLQENLRTIRFSSEQQCANAVDLLMYGSGVNVKNYNNNRAPDAAFEREFIKGLSNETRNFWINNKLRMFPESKEPKRRRLAEPVRTAQTHSEVVSLNSNMKGGSS